MNDPLEIPEHIRKAAATVEIFFRVNGIKEWVLMGIQSRRSEPTPGETKYGGYFPGAERELTAALNSFHAANQERLAERAAREQAEGSVDRQILTIREQNKCLESQRQRAKQAEARLAEAMTLLDAWLKTTAYSAHPPPRTTLKTRESWALQCEENWRMEKECDALNLKLEVAKGGLELACVASCSCQTKTPDYEYHSESCRYKALAKALAQLNESEEKK